MYVAGLRRGSACQPAAACRLGRPGGLVAIGFGAVADMSVVGLADLGKGVDKEGQAARSPGPAGRIVAVCCDCTGSVAVLGLECRDPAQTVRRGLPVEPALRTYIDFAHTAVWAVQVADHTAPEPVPVKHLADLARTYLGRAPVSCI